MSRKLSEAQRAALVALVQGDTRAIVRISHVTQASLIRAGLIRDVPSCGLAPTAAGVQAVALSADTSAWTQAEAASATANREYRRLWEVLKTALHTVWKPSDLGRADAVRALYEAAEAAAVAAEAAERKERAAVLAKLRAGGGGT